MPIQDQRTMLGQRPLSSVNEVRATWQAFGEAQGFRNGPIDKRTLERSRQPRETGATVAAYVNENRWVADCPVCNGGIAAWPDHAEGCCLDCGAIVEMTFPTPQEIAKAERVLEQRPDIVSRNWRPDIGETVDDLKVENLVHAVGL